MRQFEAGRDGPGRPCTHCNRCAARTATSPLGCCDPDRFASTEAMQEPIKEMNRPDAVG